MNGIQFILELSYVAARRRCIARLHPGAEPEVKWDCGEIERRNLAFICYLHAKLRTLFLPLSLSLSPFSPSRYGSALRLSFMPVRDGTVRYEWNIESNLLYILKVYKYTGEIKR